MRVKRPHLSSAQRHRWKEIVLHPVHGTNYILKHPFVALRIDHLDLFGNHKLPINKCFSIIKQESEEIKRINLDEAILIKALIQLYPNSEERADRLVVAGLQLHVTPVFELVDIISSPKDSVTPGRHAALPTAEIRKIFAGQLRHPSHINTAVLTVGVGGG